MQVIDIIMKGWQYSTAPLLLIPIDRPHGRETANINNVFILSGLVTQSEVNWWREQIMNQRDVAQSEINFCNFSVSKHITGELCYLSHNLTDLVNQLNGLKISQPNPSPPPPQPNPPNDPQAELWPEPSRISSFLFKLFITVIPGNMPPARLIWLFVGCLVANMTKWQMHEDVHGLSPAQ
jgi:hypothetical protein